MAKIDISNLPKPVRIAVAIVPSVILVVLIVYLVILPKNDQVEVLKKEITKQEKDISKSQSMAQRLDELKAENERIRVELKDLEQYLPEEKEISSLLKQIEDLGRKAGLEILNWKPASKRRHSSGIVYEVPVSINLTGSYHSLGRFFSSLTQMDRIVNVNNINMGSPKLEGNEASLSISFSAVTFTAIPEEEAQ